MKQDLIQVIKITKYNMLTHIPNRKYESFPNPKSLLHKDTELLRWIKTHIPL